MADYIRQLTDDEIVEARRRARRDESAEDIKSALGLSDHSSRGFREMLRRRHAIVVRTATGPRRAHAGAVTSLGNPRVSTR